MKRKLIVAGYFGRWGETDGVVTTYGSILPYLSSDNCCYDVVCYGPEDHIERRGNVIVYTIRPRIPIRVDPARWIDPCLLLSGPARFICRQQYDLVQCSSPEFMGWLALRAAARSHCPCIVVFHTALDKYARMRYERLLGAWAGRQAERIMSGYMTWFYSRADLLLAPSQTVAAELRRRYNLPVRVFSRGVDLARFNPDRRTRQSDPVRALYVGRVAPEKSLHLLVEIFSQIPDVELMVVGCGSYLEEMKRKLPGAIYTGRLNGDALADAYADSDLFVFPSRTDTLGNVVLEAMSSGLPVVVTDSLGPKELVDDGVTGYVTRTDQQFASATRQLIADNNLRRRMGAAARKHVSHRSWKNVAMALLAIHDEMLGGIPRARDEAAAGRTAHYVT